jgi:signal peptidase I
MEAQMTTHAAHWFAVRRSVLLVALAIAFFAYSVFHWVLWPIRISGDSMLPNYTDGQPNYINKLAYMTAAPARGDVVGVQVGQGEVYIKRIVGLPGERVEFHRGSILVNGKPLREPYPLKPLVWWLNPIQLGPHEYLVMGDNRTTSLLGPVRRDMIIGKAVF